MINSNHVSPNARTHESFRMNRLIAHKSYEEHYISAIRAAKLQHWSHGIFKMFGEY